jgi:hypothetical protein
MVESGRPLQDGRSEQADAAMHEVVVNSFQMDVHLVTGGISENDGFESIPLGEKNPSNKCDGGTRPGCNKRSECQG